MSTRHKKIRVAIVGYGNIGKFALESVMAENDMELAGIVRRKGSQSSPAAAVETPVVTDIKELEAVDVAILCLPSRLIKEEVPKYLEMGICTVDSFDIHGNEIWDLKTTLDTIAKKNGSCAVISAGWDPGSDSLIRGVMNLMAPRGMTFTNFGPGMSMGHSVVAKSVEGVQDAVSLTIPMGTGLHRRLVYVKLEPGVELAKVEQKIKNDSYFSHNETHVLVAQDLEKVRDMGHGVRIEHKGKSGETHNQLLSYEHRVNNPAMTSQIMVSAARAAVKQKPGCYTLLEIPVCDFLSMSLEEIVHTLV